MTEPEQQAEPEVPDWGSPPARVAFEEPGAAEEECPPLLLYGSVPEAPPAEEGVRSGNAADTDLGGQPPAPAPAPVAVAEAAAVPAPATVAPTPSAYRPAFTAYGDHVVQIAATSSTASADAEFARMSKAWPDLLSGAERFVQEADVNGKTVYRLRVGSFASKADAAAFCTAFKAQGGNCYPAVK